MAELIVRQMRESDLIEAARICRVAFGTFLGVPEPESRGLDRDYVSTRWRARPEAALAAQRDGALIGSNFASQWGSFGFFGPLTILPEFWNQGAAQKLLGPTMDLFDSWGVREAGLFTFAHSAKHLALYQRFGFWARFLTAIMTKPVAPEAKASFQKFSELNVEERRSALSHCRAVTDSILNGLDVSLEIRSVYAQSLGDTVLIEDGFAVCHCGAGTEAGEGGCYIKFAAARDPRSFGALLGACEALAAERGLATVEAGMNLGHVEAYRLMLAQGYRTQMQGVAMQWHNREAYNRSNVFVIDDWR